MMVPAAVIDRIEAHMLGAEGPPPFRAAVAAAHAAIPSSDVVRLEGQGHTMIDADPAGFVREVADFLG